MRVRVVYAVALLAVGGCGGLDPAVEGSVVLTAERPGGFVFEDTSLSSWLVGERDLTEFVVASAACHSLLGHAGDWSVRPHLVVSSRVDLVRAAEIVASGAVSRVDAERIESLLFQENGADLDVTAIADRALVRRPTAEKYVELRGQPPAAAALDRYAVYVQNVTQTRQRLVIVDASGLGSVDFGDLPGQYSSVEFRIAGDDSVETLRKEDCVDARSPSAGIPRVVRPRS